MAKTKTTKQEEIIDAGFRPLDYDTAYLETVDGHVSDYSYEPQLPAVRQPDRLVLPAQVQSGGELTQRQQYGIASANGMLTAALARPAGQPHARQDDNAVLIAHGHNIASRPKLYVVGVITLALVILAWMFWGMGMGDGLMLTVGGVVVWGSVAMVILYLDRRSTLHHTASGIEHHMIDAKAATEIAAIGAWERTMRGMIGGNDNER